jgi:hypothetical protein
VTYGSYLGTQTYWGYGASAYVNGAYIGAVADGAYTNSSAPARLVFATTPVNSTTSVERMTIDSTGNVGIGTTAPGYDLEIANANDSVGTKAAISGYYSTINSGIPNLIINRSLSNTMGTKTTTTIGTYLGQMTIQGVNASNAFNGGVWLQYVQDETAGTSYIPATFFVTTATKTGIFNYMAFDSSGHFGIGTTQPDEPLIIARANGDVPSANLISYSTAAISYYPQLKLTKSNSNTLGTLAATVNTTILGQISFQGMTSNNTTASGATIYVDQYGGSGATRVPARMFFTTTDGTNANTVMQLDHLGNVGIGVSPTAKLHVLGNTTLYGTVGIGSGVVGDMMTMNSSGYQGKIGLDATGMYILHNTNLRNISIGTYNSRTQLVLAANGTVGIGTLAGTGNRAVYSDASGILTNTASDERLKERVSDLPYGLSDATLLRPVSYYWRQDCTSSDTSTIYNLQDRLGSQKEIGLVAQEVQNIIPEVVGENSDGMLSLDYAKLVPVLLKALKDLTDIVVDLRSRVETLEAK